MQMFEGTTTPLHLVMEIDAEGIGTTNRGYLRYPQGNENYTESECDVCNGTEMVLRSRDTEEGLCEECAVAYLEELKDERAKNNPYMSYSIDTLSHLANEYSNFLGMGRTKLGNGESIGQAYQQVLQAIERREKTDYCKHGVFKWTDYDIPCGACEMGD